MKNIQIYPSKTLYFPNDAFSKKLFNLTEDDYHQAIAERKVLEVTEKRNHKKFGDIITPFRIRVDDNLEFTLSEPLEQYHFAVLCAYISECHAGNFFSTPSIIHRALTGKVGRHDAEPSKYQLADLLQATDKLMRTQIGINMTDYCQKLNCNGGKPYKIASTILPCKRVTEYTINGQENTVIYLDRQSPIWEIASMKNNQVLSCPASLINIPNQQNTRMNIAVKFYTIRRVLESIAHPKQMVPIITFHDVLYHCRLENSHREIKRRVRELILALFEHLKNEGLIKNFQLNKKGASPYSISFTF